MSKKVLGLGLLVAAIAIPFAAPAIAAAVGITGALGIAAVTAGLSLSLSLASSMLLGPSIPKAPATNPIDRLYANLDTTAARKLVFGDTAAATDIRYQCYLGDNQEYYHQVLAIASHQVQQFYEIWIDNEKAYDRATDTVLGRFAGFLHADGRDIGITGFGEGIDSTWTSNCSLTGCAWVHLRYLLLGPDEDTPSPFQGGISGRLTIRTKGALVYDPRKDSTVTGGSGSHRPDNQATWQWDDSGSRNPALQLLWYLLGWKIGSKLAVGKGMPPQRIDLASFITAANICDESVAKAGGGSEPRYRSDGVLSEADDGEAVIDTLCATMNATLRDENGKIAIAVLKNDLAAPAADFGLDDILGDEEWIQTPSLASYFNIVRGRFVDPSDNALYQLSDYPERSATSVDGIDRAQPVDYMMVQSVTQAQRLAQLRLNRGQYQGRYTAVFGPRAWQVSIGKVVRLTHAGLSWTNRLFRVAAQQITTGGAIRMTLVEENASIYDWTIGDEKAGTVAGTPPIADPTLNPALPQKNLTTLIGDSWVSGLSFSIADNGSVTISNHTRNYDDKSVSVTGTGGSPHAVSGAAAGDKIFMFYDQQSRLGGAVSYQHLRLAGGSGDASSAYASAAHPYRHFVCAGTVPASGGSTSGGSNVGVGGGTSNSPGGIGQIP